jgi:hypothetical protein
MSSCTLTERAFLNPSNYFCKGAKITKVSRTTCLINLSRGRGYECGECCSATIHLAPAGCAAAAAPEGGALAGPSAPTSTSTRWALVTSLPCQAWHGRGLNEVPATAIRGIASCREAMYGGFWKSIISID